MKISNSEIVSFIRSVYRQENEFIPLHSPVFVGNEKKYLEDCIDSTYVSSVGKYVDQFENEIARYTGSVKAVACVNGTNALFLALKLSGVNQGDEVITQPLTFIATANAISYCGSEPVFLDVDADTLGLSPERLAEWLKTNAIKDSKTAINKKTGRRIAACVPVHTFGHPARIDQIVEVCTKYSIPVVEDAAESLGSLYLGKHTGTFGKIGVLSFNGNKVITTGGGGMLLFSDSKTAEYAKHLTTQARIPHPWEFVHDAIGYNYRMPNINAALGLAQLEKMDAYLSSKREIAGLYKDFFSKTDISFIQEPLKAASNYWLNSILFKNQEDRDGFLKYSNDQKVMTRPCWQLMNKLSMFKHCQTDDLIIAQGLSERLVNIPSSVRL